MTARIYGTAFLRFPRPASWCLRIWMIPPAREPSSGTCTASVLKALGCVGYLTNGSSARVTLGPHHGNSTVRRQPHCIGCVCAYFRARSGNSHRGMDVRPGDLLHGDLHGVINVPLQVAAQIPGVAAEVQRAGRKVIEFCRSNSFPYPSSTKFEDVGLNAMEGPSRGRDDSSCQ